MERRQRRIPGNGLNLKRLRGQCIIKSVSELQLATPSHERRFRRFALAAGAPGSFAPGAATQSRSNRALPRDTLAQNRTFRRASMLSAAAAFLLGNLLLGGCREPSADKASSSKIVVVTVFAAASLTDLFQQAARSYSDSGHAGNVVFNFAGSQQLAGQLREGARADIFASANETQMQAAIDAGRIVKGSVKTFACNRLVIGYEGSAASPVSASETPAIESLQKLAQPGHKIVVGAEAVPVGRYTRQFLANAAEDDRLGPAFRNGFEANIVSEEQNARGVLSKLQLGEADAGVVYASDLVGVTDVQRIEIPAHLNISATYPIALVQDSTQPEQAAAFITWLFSAEGAVVLESHGFSTQCRAESAGVSPAKASDHAHQ